jgi:hypothetical protein
VKELEEGKKKEPSRLEKSPVWAMCRSSKASELQVGDIFSVCCNDRKMTGLRKIEHAQFEIFASSNVYAAGPVCCETQKGDKIEKGAMCTILNTPSWNEYATGAYHWLPFKTPLYLLSWTKCRCSWNNIKAWREFSQGN